MEYFWFLLLVCHVIPLALAIWGAFNRNPWIHGPAILILVSDVAGFFLANSLRVDAMFGAGFAWFLLGPVVAPLELAQAIGEAPLLAMPLIALGVTVSVLVWKRMWRRSQLRQWTCIALLAGVAVAWIAGEISVETMMRTQAAKISGSCDMRRSSTPQMLVAGLSDYGPTHGGLRDGRSTYMWSFRHFS